MIIEKLFVGMMCLLLTLFPGILVFRKSTSLPLLIRISAAASISIACWVLLVWIAFVFSIPLNGLLWTVLAVFLVLTAIDRVRNPSTLKLPAFHYSHLIFIFGMLLLLYPFITMTIPPGCDITMHGYISRLIINNNGVPLTYDPFLPDSPFGGYSAGYQALGALYAGMLPKFLHEAVNITSVSVYVLFLLNMAAFYRVFIPGKYAMLSAVFTLFIANSLKTTIGWGGNPTILAMALCLCFIALLIKGFNDHKAKTIWMSALPVSAVPMIHAIPAVTCIYISIPLVIYLIWTNIKDWKWVFTNLAIMGVIAVILVLPFALNFHNDSSVELTNMIREWQYNMMNYTITDSLPGNLMACLKQTIYRAGDPMAIIFAIGIVVMLIQKEYKPVVLIFAAALFLYLMVLNTVYWVLPLSEILYPERVMYFTIILMGIPLGYFLMFLSQWATTHTLVRRINYILITGLFILGVDGLWNGYTLSILRNNKVVCDAPAMEAFNWAAQNTADNAQFNCTYADMGMWIPAFSNRATIGTHIHFIHEVSFRFKAMAKMDVPRYYWVTVNDIKDRTPIISTVQKKKLVYHNSRVYIYQ